MKIAISIGTYKLESFAELNLCQCRLIFGPDAPILVSDGASSNSERIEALADKFGAFYIGEKTNRGHFAGDMQNTVNGLEFAKHHGADVLIKLNQRLILTHPYILKILEQVFSHEGIALALPGRPDKSRLIGPPFYASFPFLVDALCLRVAAFDPNELLAEYSASCRAGKSKYDSYIEIFWMNKINGPLSRRFAVLHCLTNHSPNHAAMFLRKIQNTEADYRVQAQRCGLPDRKFEMAEWSQIKGGQYYPFPRA